MNVDAYFDVWGPSIGGHVTRQVGAVPPDCALSSRPDVLGGGRVSAGGVADE